MPKRDKGHEEEVPKQSTTKYEGGQGDRTRARQQELRTGDPGADGDTRETGEKGPRQFRKAQKEGGARLDEDREQHDEAEKNSERNRGDLRRERPDHREDSGPGRGSAGH